MLKRIGLILFLVAIAALVFVSFKRPSDEFNNLTVAGSTTILPITQAAAEEFDRLNPDVRVLVQGGGSSAGIEAVQTRTADIGMSSRDLKPEEQELDLIDTPIAVDAITIIVNPTNRVRSLTEAQVRQIFAGRIGNWKEVGGADQEIILVNRDEASGTRDAFSKNVMKGEPFSPEAVIQPGSGQVRSIVAETPAAIGYMSLGYVNEEVRAIAFDGVKPTVSTIRNKTYALQRTLHFLTTGKPEGLALEFIDFVLSPEVQKEIVSEEFLPIAAAGGGE